ncbi:hypothetical protein JXB31_00210 [Candidatus Woesearchaeota archaeon]|nr:hypothetical protein [Candidatus Woesearchaeota archaeon]
METNKILEENQALLFVISPDNYQTFVKDFAKNYMNKGVSCYITLGRPYQSLVNNLKKMKVDTDSIFFIDTSTRMASMTLSQQDNCLFIESPSALTNLSIAMNKVVETSDPKYILFDSLSTLMIYNPEKVIIKFAKDIINKVRATNTKIVLLCLDGKDEVNIIEKISMFVDKMEHI